MDHDPSRRTRLTTNSLEQFSGDTLFCHIARAACEACCLPRKELYESWEFARRIRRRLRAGRIVEMASGHGLVSLILLLLDDRSPNAVAVDIRIPESAKKLRASFEARWPKLQGRLEFIQGSLETVPVTPEDIVVSAHACGLLTDLVLDRAISARASTAVLPCCQSEAKSDSGGLLGWMDAAMAIDVTRARRLAAAGYQVVTQTIPETITPKNRVLIGIAPR